MVTGETKTVHEWTPCKDRSGALSLAGRSHTPDTMIRGAEEWMWISPVDMLTQPDIAYRVTNVS